MGACLSLISALALYADLPFVRDAEVRATDLLFLYGRPDAPAPSDRIVHVDIDDGSLDTVARWPWPRRLLAQSVAALDRFGARVIAFDILFPEPQAPDYQSDGSVIDHDRELEEAIRAAKATVLLAVSLESADTQLGPLWRGKAGSERWKAVLSALRSNITAEADDLIRTLGLDSDRAARVRDKLREMKRIAIREVAGELARAERLSLETLRTALLPPGGDRLGKFPELTLMQGEIEAFLAGQRFEHLLPRARPGNALPKADTLMAPLPRFADVADGSGFVNATNDADGQIRRVPLRWEKSGRIYFQLGLAAAMAYRGLSPDLFTEETAEIPAGAGTVHVDEQPMALSWPRIDPVRLALGFAPHIALGRVLEISWREEALDRLRARERTLALELIRAFLAADGFVPSDLDDPQRAPEVVAALHEHAAWMLEKADPQGSGDAESLQKERTAREWLETTEEVARSTHELSGAANQLRVAIEGHIVFVGANASGKFGDFYPTVAHEQTPGVVTHAIVANTFLTGYQVLPAPLSIGAGVALALGLMTALFTTFLGTRLSLLVAMLLAILFVVVDTLVVFNGMGFALATATPLVSIGLAWTGTTAVRAIHALREKAQLQRQFGARISRQLFDFLLENPELVHLAGEEREVCCFFSDLAGFTGISESLDSRTTVSILNRYMWEMNDELTKYQAYVNKFLGDGIMAVWGAFETGTPYAERACRAALGCFQRLDLMLARQEFRDLPKLSMRIGLATGVVTVGDCGAPPDLRDYTVIGDSANLAARLESANKQFGTRILINGRTKELITEDLVTRPLGRVAVVGQKTATEIHELIAVRGQETEEQRTLVRQTSQAVAAFAERRLDESRTLWNGILADHGESPLARHYLAEIERVRGDAADKFDGVLRLTVK